MPACRRALVHDMSKLWGNQLHPVDPDPTASSPPVCARSVLHDLDLATRKILSQVQGDSTSSQHLMHHPGGCCESALSCIYSNMSPWFQRMQPAELLACREVGLQDRCHCAMPRNAMPWLCDMPPFCVRSSILEFRLNRLRLELLQQARSLEPEALEASWLDLAASFASQGSHM
jgi:hypothetical protein